MKCLQHIDKHQRIQETPIYSLCCCYCSVVKSCLTLCDPLYSVIHYLLEFAQIHIHWGGHAILTISSSTILFSFCLQSFSASCTNYPDLTNVNILSYMLQTSFPLKHLIVQLWLDARHTLFFFLILQKDQTQPNFRVPGFFWRERGVKLCSLWEPSSLTRDCNQALSHKSAES